MANTGYKHYNTRTLYFLDGPGESSGVTENNLFDENYIHDVFDTITCPVGGLDLSQIVMSGSPETTSLNACSNTTYTNRWHDGDGIYPIVGDKIYADIYGAPFNGASFWWKIYDSGTVVQIVSDGTITSIYTCT